MAEPVYSFERDLERVAISLKANSAGLAARLKAKIGEMMDYGMDERSIVDVLKKDLGGGGPLFSGLQSSFRSAVNPTVDNVAQGAVVQANPRERGWQWITTSAEPCGDCLPRHGDILSWDNWQAVGLPRSGFSVCGENCKCTLIPEAFIGDSAAEGPVEVPTLASARKDFMERMESDPDLQARMTAYEESIRSARSAAGGD